MAFGSIDSIMKIIDFLNVPFIEIRRGQCSNIRLKGSCDKCTKFCPTDALGIEGDVTIDPKKCIRCGSCQTVCHSGVFTVLDGSDETYLSEIDIISSDYNRILFECNGCFNTFRIKRKKAPKGTGKLVVPCLGRINEIMLLRCRELGFSDVSFSECHPKCPFNGAKLALDEISDLAEILANALNLRPTASDNNSIFTKDHAKKGNASDRRDFVFALGKRAAAIALDVNKTKQGLGKQGQILPLRRGFLISYAENYDISDFKTKIGNLPFSEIAIENTCDLCGACTYICPTGALRTKEDNTELSLVFEFAQCIGCGLCDKICDRGSIIIKDSVDLGNLITDPQIIYSLSARNCTKCNMQFHSNSDSQFCPGCEKREGLRAYMTSSSNNG
jgi:ferredoxin